MFVFSCPNCHRQLSVPPRFAGQQGRCPHCTCYINLQLSASTANGEPAFSSSSLLAMLPEGAPPETFGGASEHQDGLPEDDRTEIVDLPAVPGYELLGVLGRGGMGVVYKARQRALNRVVALKMILIGSQVGGHETARFQAEAETLARLKHPNIVQIHEVGEWRAEGAAGAVTFFSLEFVEGGTLAQRLRAAPLPPREGAEIVCRLAQAVDVAHQAGIIHRDLKPGNVLLTADGQPKVTDFGLAKQLDGDAGQTRSGTILGTPSYMAPEQASGKGQNVGPLADVYALGAILYECLTGSPPFRAPTALETLVLVTLDEPISPRRLRRQIPPDLETICLKCLEKEPLRRYGSARALADDLQRFLDGRPVEARPVRGWERFLKWAHRKPAVAALSVGLLLTLILGLVTTSLLYLRADSDRKDAVEKRKEADAAVMREATTAAAEKKSRQDAESARQKAETATAQALKENERALKETERAEDKSRLAQLHTALLHLESGRNLCELGEVGQGLLSFVKALESAPADALTLKHAARLSLSVSPSGGRPGGVLFSRRPNAADPRRRPHRTPVAAARPERAAAPLRPGRRSQPGLHAGQQAGPGDRQRRAAHGEHLRPASGRRRSAHASR